MDNYSHTQNLYDFLGVHQKSDRDEIKSAYRKKLKQWHPDINPHRKEAAEEMTKILNQVYEILSDPEQRKNYDNMLRFTQGKKVDAINDRTFWSKLSKVSPMFKETLGSVRELYGMFRDAIVGNYKLHPLTFGLIAGGLLYFLTPMDVIPDLFPIIGFFDDMVVLTTIINSLHTELGDYQKWKKNIEGGDGKTAMDT